MTSPNYFRLVGTKGLRAAVGEVTEVENGKACWKLHPVYAAWFWPLMQPATELALSVPEALLEPIQASDSIEVPRRPTESEKNALLKAPELAEDAVVVHTLVLKGKPPSVRKAFPTRTVSLHAMRYCRARMSSKTKADSAE